MKTRVQGEERAHVETRPRPSHSDSPPKINSPVAWVDHYPADIAGKSSEEECSTSREDYTQHEITLEVHQEPSDHSQCKTGKCRKSGKAP